ncbi:hypothetical protein FB645_004987 [Coemansia sp. IMI 203386]|nr:hypothetical protein FB645_004987 [Coemansia sp. IMI 203386]
MNSKKQAQTVRKKTSLPESVLQKTLDPAPISVLPLGLEGWNKSEQQLSQPVALADATDASCADTASVRQRRHRRQISGGSIKRMLHAVSERTFRSGEREREHISGDRRRALSRHSRSSLGALFGRRSQTQLAQNEADACADSGEVVPPAIDGEIFSSSSNSSDKALATEASVQKQEDKDEDGAGTDEDGLLMTGCMQQNIGHVSPVLAAESPHDSTPSEIVHAAGNEGSVMETEDSPANQMGSLKMPRPAERTATFTAQYLAEPAPGVWEGDRANGASSGMPGQRQQRDATQRPNVPLEPEECSNPSMPWLVEQMGMGERPFSSLFEDSGYGVSGGESRENNNGSSDDDNGNSNNNNRKSQSHKHIDGSRHERKRRRKQAFEVLKQRVTEARVGIPREPPAPRIDSFKRPDGTVDYTRYGCSLAKHYADTRLQHKLDYRHDSKDPCKLDKFIITLQRLVEASAPYQRFLVWLYKLARWDNPRLSLWWCGVYFLLLYMGMITMFLWMTPVFITAYYRLRPSDAHSWLAFERPETSIIPSKILRDASSGTLGKGLIANRMWDLWRETLGAHVHIYLADVADWMERAKNCATWQRPWASRAVMTVCTCFALFVYLIPANVLQKLFGICVGVQFFFLSPLQLRYQRYRRMLCVVDCLLWHCPTDVELAIDTLYMPKLCKRSSHNHSHHHSHDHDHGHIGDPGSSTSDKYRHGDNSDGHVFFKDQCDDAAATSTPKAASGPREYIRRMYSDMMLAYNPLAKRRYPPVMILQTASSASLDRLGDESDDSTDISAVHEALSAGRRFGKKILLGSSNVEYEDDRYTGIGANGIGDDSTFHLPSMMEPSEEQEWMRNAGLFKPISRTHSVDSFVSMDKERIIARPTSLRHTRRVSDEDVPSILLNDKDVNESINLPESRSSGTDNSGKSSGSESRGAGRSLLSRAKSQISSKLKRTHVHQSNSSPVPQVVPSEMVGSLERPNLRHSIAIPTLESQDTGKRRTISMLDLASLDLSELGKDMPEGSSGNKDADAGNSYSLSNKLLENLRPYGTQNSGNPRSPIASIADSADSSSLELTHETKQLAALRNKDARSTNNVVDLNSLYAFRCIHQGKYGTLFVTADQFVFRRSRIMGGRRSSVSSYLLSNVIAIRKSTGRIGKSHGIQILLNDGKPYHFYGLPKRDDVFGYLLVRCGNNHAY